MYLQVAMSDLGHLLVSHQSHNFLMNIVAECLSMRDIILRGR